VLAGFEYKLWCRFLVIWLPDNRCNRCSFLLSSSIDIIVTVTQSSRLNSGGCKQGCVIALCIL
jgi:hypothetical protein